MIIISCVKGNNSKNTRNEIETTSSGSSSGRSDRNQKMNSSKGKSTISDDLVAITYSESSHINDYGIDRKKAQSIARDLNSDLGSPTIRDQEKLIALMASSRLSGKKFNEIMSIAKRLVSIKIRKNIDSDIPDILYLELALSAYQHNKYTMAEFFLQNPLRSKNSLIVASGLTLMGIIVSNEGKYSEAMSYWEQALKARPNFKAAELNRGFMGLRFGDYNMAVNSLRKFKEEWYPMSGLIVAERLAGNGAKAKEYCDEFLKKKNDYKPAIFSCALNDYQGLGKLSEAKERLRKLGKNSDGNSGFDEKAYLIIGRIEKEEQQNQLKKKIHSSKKNNTGKTIEGKK